MEMSMKVPQKSKNRPDEVTYVHNPSYLGVEIGRIRDQEDQNFRPARAKS
jgi:hypothetical protein